jgi:hypothetical protein
VIVAGATASLAPESMAQVHNDPKMDQHEILMKKGCGRSDAQWRDRAVGELGKSEFPGKSEAHMEKAKGTGPPTPISPANMAPIFTSARDDQGCGIFLDADGECFWLPASHIAESRTFLLHW